MKKLLVSLAVLLLLLPNGVLCVGAVSQSPVKVTEEIGYTQVVQFDPRTAISNTANHAVTAAPLYGENADTPYTFYAYLNQWQKDVYNGLLRAGLNSADSTNGVLITFTTPITCQNTTASLTAEAQETFYLAVQGGISALMDDHPELFWLGGYSASLVDAYAYPNGNGYDIEIQSIRCKIQYKTTVYADKAAVTDYYNRMMAAFDAFEVKGYTRYEKVKSIHDTIAKQVTYDPNYDNANANGTAHEPTSVFLEPFLPVCEGYAEAFKMLCDREGIPCVIVVGKAKDSSGELVGHAWNYVKMEDGKWYAVDLTWDDPVGNSADGVFYDFFLVGSQATNWYFDRDTTTFEDKHTPTGDRIGDGLYILPYPALSQTAYVLMLGDANADIAVRKADGIVLLGKNQSLSTAFIAPYGSTVSVSGATTGGSVTVTKGGTTTTYTVARRGDVVADNTVNTADYEKVAKATVGAVTITDKAQFAAADLNGDGAVDAFDASLLDMYINGEALY